MSPKSLDEVLILMESARSPHELSEARAVGDDWLERHPSDAPAVGAALEQVWKLQTAQTAMDAERRVREGLTR